MEALYSLIYQYAYFFSLMLIILPLTLFIDYWLEFAVLKKLLTKQGLIYLAATIAFWSAYDLIWTRQLGSFPANRIIFSVLGVPLEEILLFGIGFYNVITIFAFTKKKFSKAE